MKMDCGNRCLVLACIVLLLAMLAASPAAAQCLQTGGFTRTYQQSSVGGTFVPPQTHVSETFYSHPGISAYGPYPGSGIAYEGGIGFTPGGYMPYGGYTAL